MIVFIFDKAPFPSCHASTIVEVEPGRFLAAWFGGKDEGANDVKIWMAHFDGKKWTPPEVAAEEPGIPCWNPVLFRCRDKSILLFYRAGPSPMTWTTYLRRSTEGGKTWSKTEQFPAGLLGPIKNKPIHLADGTILAGSSVESYKVWTGWIERSPDNGKSWRRFGPIAVPGHPYGIIQPTLFQMPAKPKRAPGNEAILALCRARGVGFICRSESSDSGETWSPAQPTELPNPNSGIDGVRAANGDLYLVYNHTKQGRSPLNVARSQDASKTWKMVATLEDQSGEFSYPAIIQAEDKRLHVTYTWNRRHIKHVILEPEKLG